MKFLSINWNHGREKAEEFIRQRQLIRFALADTGEMIEGYIVAIRGECHAKVEVTQRGPYKQQTSRGDETNEQRQRRQRRQERQRRRQGKTDAAAKSDSQPSPTFPESAGADRPRREVT